MKIDMYHTREMFSFVDKLYYYNKTIKRIQEVLQDIERVQMDK